MWNIRCIPCAQAADPSSLPVHLHYTLVEGFVLTSFWSDGTKTATTRHGYKIEGALF